MMSAGFDSRLLLAGLSDVDVCYTLGTPSTPEVEIARKLAAQYGAHHHLLHVNDDYLLAAPDIVRYTQGVRESVHIHHRGNANEITTDTIYHGLLLDTLLRGHYLPVIRSTSAPSVGTSPPSAQTRTRRSVRVRRQAGLLRRRRPSVG
ncbi:adenine nucleotide alpha hydrolase family protein [Halalkalicoccus salilacus]|uniref:hypothetical protein n=1 Tax=Halalkalicoccus sp. GCM10025704 TaxID=3252662 RepID=UPI00361EBB72